MPYCMYVTVNEDNKISVFTVDPESGGLTHQRDVAVPGGPFTLAISPDRNHLYCGTRRQFVGGQHRRTEAPGGAPSVCKARHSSTSSPLGPYTGSIAPARQPVHCGAGVCTNTPGITCKLRHYETDSACRIPNRIALPRP